MFLYETDFNDPKSLSVKNCPRKPRTVPYEENGKKWKVNYGNGQITGMVRIDFCIS